MSDIGENPVEDATVYLSSLAAEAVRKVLSNEDWYSGQVISWPGARTATEAVQYRLRKIKRLRRFRASFQGAAELADGQDGCAYRTRCLSSACYECVRVFQQWVARESCNLARKTDEPFEAVNIIFPQKPVPVGHLADLDIADLRATLNVALESVDFEGLAFLGLDLSLNDDTQWRNGDIYWQPHFRGIISPQTPGFVRKLARALGQIPGVRRPVAAKEYDGSYYGGSYTFKTYFDRRVRYLKLENGRFRTRTSKLGLNAAADIESMLYLHELGFYRRLYLRNIEIIVDEKNASMRQLE